MTSFQLCNSMTGNIVPSMIDRWIQFAMIRNVENMSLDLGFSYGSCNYALPDYFFINSSVKQLIVMLYDYDTKIPSCSVSWTSLKKLSLQCCKLSNECLAKIISGCPVLESLTLYSFQNLLVIDLSKSLSLKTLEIYSIGIHQRLQIVAPHIHCLRLAISQQVPCSLVDVSSLIEARLDISLWSFKERIADCLQVMALKMLETLQNVEKFTFRESFLKLLSLADLGGVHFPMFKIKALTFETMISQYVIPAIVRVLQNSPELKTLTLHTTMGSHHIIPEKDIDYYLDLKGLNLDHCSSLKARVFENVHHKNVEAKHVASFMELMVKNTKTLEMLVVRLGGLLKGRSFEELFEMVPMLFEDNNISIVLRK